MNALRLGYSLLTVRPGHIGGAETYVQGLLSALARRDDIETIAILANREVERAYGGIVDDRISLRRVGGMEPTGSNAVRAARLVRGLARPARLIDAPTRDVDVVHFPVAVGIPEPRVPWAVTLHDVAHHAVPEHFTRAEHAYRALAYDRSARRANLVITVSEHARGQIIEYLGIAPEKVLAVHHGIDLERYRPAPVETDEQILAALVLPDRFVYYPANMWPHKNHLALVEAIAHLADRDLHLVLTGQTYGRDGELADAARRAGVADRIHHLGYVSASAVPALYRKCLGMVFPSLFEGFGSPPLEAMACGAPVAASSAGSLPEVLGEAALTFDPTAPDAIAAVIDRLAADEALRAKLAAAGPLQASSFTWERSADRHADAYRTLITQDESSRFQQNSTGMIRALPSSLRTVLSRSGTAPKPDPVAENPYAAGTHQSPHWIVRYPHQKRFALAVKAMAPTAGLRILDYGAGDGYLFTALADAHPKLEMDAVGYEPVPKYADLFRSSPRPASRLNIELLTNLDEAAAQSFDVITCMAVLEHLPLPERQRFYETCERLLRPGGRVVIEVPVELGPSVVVKDLGRKILKGREFENPPKQMLALAVGQRMFDPARFDPDSNSTWIQDHEGFDYRLFARELNRRFRVIDTFGTPLPKLPPWLGNQEVFFVFEIRSEAERAQRRADEASSTPE